MTSAAKAMPERPAGGAVGREAICLYLVIFLDCLSFAMIMPYLPFILRDRGGDAGAGGVIVAIHALAAVVSAPVLGWLSDRFGRKVVLVATTLGTAASYVLFAFSPSLLVLAVSRAVGGLMAGNAGVVQAGLADATTQADRGRAMSFSMAAWGLGYLVGPATGAGLSLADKDSAALAVSLLGAAVSLLSGVVLWLAYPTGTGGVPQGGPSEASRTPGKTRSVVLEMIILLGLLSLAQNGLAAMTGFWANASFGWTERGVSVLMFGVAAAIIVVQLAVSPALSRRLGAPRLLVAAVGVSILGCLLLWLGQSYVPLMAGSATILFCGLTVGQAMANTLLANAIGHGRGRAMGWAASAGALGRVVGPASFGFLFVSVGHQSPFVAVLGILGLFMLWRLASRLAGRPGAAPSAEAD